MLAPLGSLDIEANGKDGSASFHPQIARIGSVHCAETGRLQDGLIIRLRQTANISCVWCKQ